MSAAKHLKPWQPGQSGNPSGRPRLPDELRAIQSLTRPESMKIISKYARMSMSKLEELIEDKSIPAIDFTVISIFVKAAQLGDERKLRFLLEEAMGRLPIIEETDEDKAARKEIEDLSDGELLKLVVAKLPELTAKGTDEPA